MCCPDHQITSAFVDGELEAAQAAEVERHVAACVSCRQFVQEMRWLEGCGRAALGAIHVREAFSLNIVRPEPPRRSSFNIYLPLFAPLRAQLFTFRWASLAAVWIAILALNHAARDTSSVVTAKATPISPQMILVLRQQQKRLAELIEAPAPRGADKPKSFSPRPRSELLSPILSA